MSKQIEDIYDSSQSNSDQNDEEAQVVGSPAGLYNQNFKKLDFGKKKTVTIDTIQMIKDNPRSRECKVYKEINKSQIHMRMKNLRHSLDQKIISEKKSATQQAQDMLEVVSGTNFSFSRTKSTRLDPSNSYGSKYFM